MTLARTLSSSRTAHAEVRPLSLVSHSFLLPSPYLGPMERYTSGKHRGSGGSGGSGGNSSPLRFKKKDQNDHDRCVPWYPASLPLLYSPLRPDNILILCILSHSFGKKTVSLFCLLLPPLPRLPPSLLPSSPTYLPNSDEEGGEIDGLPSSSTSSPLRGKGANNGNYKTLPVAVDDVGREGEREGGRE